MKSLLELTGLSRKRNETNPVAIADAGFIAEVAKRGRLSHLEEFSGELIVPSTVKKQLLTLKQNPTAVSFARYLPDWANELSPKNKSGRLPLEHWSNLTHRSRHEIRYLIEDLSAEGKITLFSSDDNPFLQQVKERGYVDQCNLCNFFVAAAGWEVFKKCEHLKDGKHFGERIDEFVKELSSLTHFLSREHERRAEVKRDLSLVVDREEPEHDRGP